MVELVWLIPMLPLLGFLILLITGHLLGEPRAGWVATAFAGASFIATLIVLVGLLGKDSQAGGRSYEFVLSNGYLLDP